MGLRSRLDMTFFFALTRMYELTISDLALRRAKPRAVRTSQFVKFSSNGDRQLNHIVEEARLMMLLK